jgi:3-hydroxyisobutyrate dehydrogenase
MIAFLGTGLMGSAFAEAALKRGELVQVWNRTPTRAARLAQLGARVRDEPAEAVRGADRVHLSLSDDAAVDAVLARALPGLAPGAVLVDHTTTAPAPTRSRTCDLAARGFVYLHAPVFMGPQNAREASGLMLTCGPEARLGPVRPELARMTGRLLHLGDGEDRAAAFKLFGNMMIVFMASGLADVFGLARGLGIAPAEALGLFDAFKVANQLDHRGKRMARGDFEPSFELAMARKDVRLMLESAAGAGVELQVLPAIAQRMDALLAEGLGGRDLGVLAKEPGR